MLLTHFRFDKMSFRVSRRGEDYEEISIITYMKYTIAPPAVPVPQPFPCSESEARKNVNCRAPVQVQPGGVFPGSFEGLVKTPPRITARGVNHYFTKILTLTPPPRLTEE